MEEQNKDIQELHNDKFKFVSQGEFPNIIITMTYKDQLLYKFDHGISKFPSENNFNSFTLDKIENFNNDFYDDYFKFAKENENKPDSLCKLAETTFLLILGSLKNIIEEKKKPKSHPEYIDKLIDKALIKKDGCSVIQSLTDVANFLVKECNIKVTEKFLFETFRKTNGDYFSDSACKGAITNSPYVKPLSKQ